MYVANGSKTRGTIIKVPDAGPGLLFVNGRQTPFSLEGRWKSATAPVPNMTVELDYDTAGAIVGITAVDSQQLAKERLEQLGGLAQQHGRQAADLARQGVGALAARMGTITLTAVVAIWIAWFFLPAVTVSFFVISKSLTFWELLALDPGNLMDPLNGSRGFTGLLGLAALVAPFAAPFIPDSRAKWLYATPLAFLILVGVSRWLEFRRITSDLPVVDLSELFSLGVGIYVLVVASVVLAWQAGRSRVAA